MPVFISHRTADDTQAQQVALRLQRVHGIKCYLDDFDPNAATTAHITRVIVGAINKCTHLLALITDDTRGSWWVPFEIGVARQADRRITTYDASQYKLPEYLNEWPIVSGDTATDAFARLYKKDQQSQHDSQPLMEKYGATTAAIYTYSADDFHRDLKSALGQK